MLAIARSLRSRNGPDLGRYKPAYALRRVQARVRALGMSDLGAYARHMEAHPEEADRLGRSLNVKVTWFFRNASFFGLLAARVLPEILAHAPRAAAIWSAGCATGEEAYSIAMLLASRAGGRAAWVLGTDRDQAAIGRARRGEYAAACLRFIPPDLARRYMEPAGPDRVRVRPEAARLVRFRAAELLEVPRRPAFDLVVCRNVLIYFDASHQKEILARLVASLRPGGYLALGRAERVVDGPGAYALAAVSVSQRVYRRV